VAVEEDEVCSSSGVVRFIHPKQPLDRGARAADAAWIDLVHPKARRLRPAGFRLPSVLLDPTLPNSPSLIDFAHSRSSVEGLGDTPNFGICSVTEI